MESLRKDLRNYPKKSRINVVNVDTKEIKADMKNHIMMKSFLGFSYKNYEKLSFQRKKFPRFFTEIS